MFYDSEENESSSVGAAWEVFFVGFFRDSDQGLLQKNVVSEADKVACVSILGPVEMDLS